MDSIERVILRNLLKNDSYVRKVLPFIKEDYFSGSDKKLYQTIHKFILKYNIPPTCDTLIVDLDNDKSVTENEFADVQETLKSFQEEKTETPIDWLIASTEQFCQDRALYNAIAEALEIIKENPKVGASKGSIPKLLSDALGVTFDPNVGHDYLEQYLDRFEYYHRTEDRIPFDLDFLNKITKGGLPSKTLNIVMASTGVGKSLFMCHMAAACTSMGKNVLYITLELSEEEVGKRIDANLLNVTFDELMALSKDMYEKRVVRLKNKTSGKMIVKQYPTAGASVIHFKSLLNELALKKSFKPDIIFVDYLNLCMSARIKMGGSVNSYTYIKSIAEELRGLAVEHNVPIVSATQVNRAGFNNSDIGMENTSESFGLPATADLMIALIATDDLTALGQLMVKQLKNRYNDENENRRFVIGIDKKKMKLFDAEPGAQKNITDSGQEPEKKKFEKPVFDKDKFKRLKVS